MRTISVLHKTEGGGKSYDCHVIDSKRITRNGAKRSKRKIMEGWVVHVTRGEGLKCGCSLVWGERAKEIGRQHRRKEQNLKQERRDFLSSRRKN